MKYVKIGTSGEDSKKEVYMRLWLVIVGILHLQYPVVFTITAHVIHGMEWAGILFMGIGFMYILGALKWSPPMINTAALVEFSVTTILISVFLQSMAWGWRFGFFWGTSPLVFVPTYGTSLVLSAYAFYMHFAGHRTSHVRVKWNITSPVALKVLAVTVLLALLLGALLDYSYATYALEDRGINPSYDKPEKSLRVAALGVDTKNQWSTESPAVSSEALDMVSDLNSSTVSFDLYYDAWMDGDDGILSTNDRIISECRASNLSVMLNDRFLYKPQRHMSFDAYGSTHREYLRKAAERWKPDYFTILCSPSFLMDPGPVEETSKEMWMREIEMEISVVEEASPNTKIGVSIADRPLDWDIYRSLLKLPGLDYIGIEVYMPSSAEIVWNWDTIGDFRNNMKTIPSYYGKGLVVTAAWTSYAPSLCLPWRQEWDIGWLRNVYEFSRSVGANIFIASSAYNMITYGPPTPWMDTTSRTAVWDAYRSF